MYILSLTSGDTGTIVTVLAIMQYKLKEDLLLGDILKHLLLVPRMECLHWRWQPGICKTFKAAAKYTPATVASLYPSVGHQEVMLCTLVIIREVSLVSIS